MSRAKELAGLFPSHDCAAWLGHSEKIAGEFYRQVTSAHFERATAQQTQACSALHKALRSSAKSRGTASSDEARETMQVANNKALGGAPVKGRLGGKGLEPLTSSV